MMSGSDIFLSFLILAPNGLPYIISKWFGPKYIAGI